MQRRTFVPLQATRLSSVRQGRKGSGWCCAEGWPALGQLTACTVRLCIRGWDASKWVEGGRAPLRHACQVCPTDSPLLRPGRGLLSMQTQLCEHMSCCVPGAACWGCTDCWGVPHPGIMALLTEAVHATSLPWLAGSCRGHNSRLAMCALQECLRLPCTLEAKPKHDGLL